MVAKYIGGGEDSNVRLSRLGGDTWEKTKKKAKAAAQDLADGLIQLYAQRKRLPGYAWAGFGLILGGAAGNLFDRLAYGYVIDMLEPLFARLFVFNPADAAVVCGAVLLGVYLLFGKEDTPDERA